MDTKLASLIDRLEAATLKLEMASNGSIPSVSPTSGDDQPARPSLVAFDELIKGPLAEYLAAAKTIGGLVAEQGLAFERAAVAQRQFSSTRIDSSFNRYRIQATRCKDIARSSEAYPKRNVDYC